MNTVPSMNSHHAKIKDAKFDGTNNFGKWRYEVLDALIAQNLDTMELDTAGMDEHVTQDQEEQDGVWGN